MSHARRRTARAAAIAVAPVVLACLAGCAGAPAPPPEVQPVSAVAPLSTPESLTASYEDGTLLVSWATPAEVTYDKVRLYIDGDEPILLDPGAAPYEAEVSLEPGREHLLQLQGWSGQRASLPATVTVDLPFPAPVAAPTAQPVAAPAPQPVTASAPAPVATAPAPAPVATAAPAPAPVATAAVAPDYCTTVSGEQKTAALILRDWEKNLAVQGDVGDTLSSVGDNLAALSFEVTGEAGGQIEALTDSVKLLRMNFVSGGGVLPDGVQDGPRDYDTLKADILEGTVSGC